MKIRAKIKIGNLVEALGCTNSGQELIAPATLKINTPYGYKKVEAIRKTPLNSEWMVKTKNFSTTVADEHKFQTKNGTYQDDKYWKNAKDLKIEDEIFTENGWEKITICQHNGRHSNMYDLQVEDCHSYFADGFHGHNSIFLPNFGFHALRNGKNVIHYSMEMSEARVGQRYDSIASSIYTKQLQDNRDEIKESYDTLKKVTSTRLRIKEFPTGMASILDLEAHMEELKLHENFTPDVVIVDYGDIMRSTRKTNNNYEEQGWIYRELRGLAVKKNIAVITASQATRDSLKGDGGSAENIGMDKMADSMEKNRILDALFSIIQTKREKEDGVINLWTAKNRNGEAAKTLQFKINYRNFRITESLLGVAKPDEAEDD